MTDLNSQAPADDDTTDASVNDTRFDGAVKKARAYGRDTAIGADALPKLSLEVVRWSKDGTIELDPDKGGDKKQMHVVYGAYWDQRVKKGVHAQGKEGRAAQVSKLKRFYDLGKLTAFDPEEFMDRVVEIYHEQLAAETKLQSVYAAYVNAARMAVEWKADPSVLDADGNQATEPTDEQIIAAITPKDKPEKTISDVIDHIKELLTDVISGERKDGLSCQDTEITDAAESLQKWLAKMAMAAELDAYHLQAAKLRAAGLI